MIHASAIAESIVAPTLLRPEFLHRLGQNRKSVTATRMSEAGGEADFDLIAQAAGRVLEAAGTDSPAPGNAHTDATRPSDAPGYPQEQDGAPAGHSTAQRPEAV